MRGVEIEMPWAAIQSQLDRWEPVLFCAYAVSLLAVIARARDVDGGLLETWKKQGAWRLAAFIFVGRSNDRLMTVLLAVARVLIAVWLVVTAYNMVAVFIEPECVRMRIGCPT